MPHPSVHWHEGMFLRPHHFQAADRYWTETLRSSEQWDHAYNYGLRRLEYSRDALANQQLEIRHCEARLRDGTLVSLGPGELNRVELGPALQEVSALGSKAPDIRDGENDEAGPVLAIYLALPVLSSQSANVSIATEERQMGSHRFHEVIESPADESRGGNEQPVRFRRPNVQLRLSTQALSGYEYLQIANVRRSGAIGGAPQVSDYIPPLLTIDAWEPLSLGIVRNLYDWVGRQITRLSQLVLDRGTTLTSQEPRDVERFFKLALLNEVHATLQAITFAKGVHPFTAYAELCRAVGKLSIFGRTRRAAEIPIYDHDNLGRVFPPLRRLIEELVYEEDDGYEQRNFTKHGPKMQVALERKWLDDDWQWYVGVWSADVTEDECRFLLQPGRLDWKVGSHREVDAIFDKGRIGVKVQPAPRTPSKLPQNDRWAYYEVGRDSPDWSDVANAGTLALKFTEKLIENRDGQEGALTLLVRDRGKQIGLKFSLFAVRRAT